MTGDEPTQSIANGEAEHGPDPKVQAEVDKVVKQLKDADQPSEADADGAAEDETPTHAIDKFEPAVEGGDLLPQPADSTTDPASLFSNYTFFLSRETPRQPLEFILKAFELQEDRMGLRPRRWCLHHKRAGSNNHPSDRRQASRPGCCQPGW